MRLNPLPLARPFSYTPPSQLPRKDAQHKDSINTEATEYSKSGTDDAAARQEGAAFDPESTRPEEEMEQAGKGHGEGANPLEVSPANGEVSRGTEGGVERSEEGVDGGGRKGSGFGRGGRAGEVVGVEGVWVVFGGDGVLRIGLYMYFKLPNLAEL
ncbi:hypothetical protein EYC80_009495 [Monilinia laxa]|uniref:Uncharacterized protein n=1 Tax=Monilinia laxa TaxID=61186 RepID=A0A5N6JY74_MONLA|nr:hypothetical protein EYC80_009495 [Monilinia laxa]